MAESSTPRGKRLPTASQACQSCRRKKIRCDEQRPRCRNCMHREFECEYEESLPDKVDRTTSLILQKLDRVQANLNQLSLTDSAASVGDSEADVRQHTRRVRAAWQQSRSQPSHSSSYGYGAHGSERTRHKDRVRGPLTVPHKILLWPNIRDRMLSAAVHVAPDLSRLWAEGSTWFIKHELKTRSGILPVDMSLPDQDLTSERDRPRGLFLRDLKITRVLEYTNAYFDTFNMLFPILSRRRFIDEVVYQVVQEGHPDSTWRSVIALFVFALGQVAIEGTLNPPVSTVEGKPSGLRGGSLRVPPGLYNFNEARRRLNLLPMHDTLEKVQGLLLQAIYFQCSSQHVDYWQSVVSASMVCRVLITCKVDDFDSSRGDLVKRAYWTCVLHEELFHVDMDLPGTALVTMEDDVPLPHFHEMGEEGMASDQQQNEHEVSMAYFLAMITLRRIVGRVHDLLDEFETGRSGHGGAPAALLGEMARQLDAWRDALPPSLRWLDSDLLRTPDDTDLQLLEPESPFGPSPTRRETWPVDSRSGLDIVTAMLQARFYHTRITLHLPSVYRALHGEQLTSIEDADGFVAAIQSACDLPLVMAPLQGKKRLVPHQFTWIQSFTGTLLILRVVSEDEQLRAHCEGEIETYRFKNAETIMLEWLRDIKQVDGVADWSWQVLNPLYFPSQPARAATEDQSFFADE